MLLNVFLFYITLLCIIILTECTKCIDVNCYFSAVCSDHCPKRKNNSFAYSIVLIEKLIVSRNSNLIWEENCGKH